MRKVIFSLVIVITSLGGFGQRTTRIATYLLPVEPKPEKILIIKMPFGKADIVEISGDTGKLDAAADIFIDVVFTDYPSAASLKQLNKKRVAAFLQRFPFLKFKQLAGINLLRQLDGREKEIAAGMFHGLVVRYRPRQSTQSMKEDIADLDNLVTAMETDSVSVVKTEAVEIRDSIIKKLKLKKGLLTDKNSGPVKYETTAYDMCVTGYVGYKHLPDDSSINISPRQALKKKLISKAACKAYDWTPLVTLFFRRIDSNAKKNDKPGLKDVTVTDTLKKIYPVVLPDSTLLKIFARTKWKNFTVVEDVTVSMYPYSAQLLLWIRLHGLESITNNFVFFNDGDEKAENEKITGSTGGIYPGICTSFGQVKKLIKETMSKGSGGDRPEYDIEALLAGEREFPGNDFQVLIADNRAPIKDKILSGKLTRPVRIILCGANDYNINVDYLNLARQTKGSIHLINQDISAPALLKEGEILNVGQKIFKVEKNIFIEIEHSDK
ncbi:MAG: hypothetical protein H7258_12065 [Ferruginibacter sp.]|nr:hypothetical protein [Ferruginibacter sp.]